MIQACRANVRFPPIPDLPGWQSKHRRQTWRASENRREKGALASGQLHVAMQAFSAEQEVGWVDRSFLPKAPQAGPKRGRPLQLKFPPSLLEVS